MKKWLRRIVGDTSLETIAHRARYSTSAVSNAVGGARVPRLRLVRSVAAAVNASEQHTLWLWRAAALEEFERENTKHGGLAEPESPLAAFAMDLRKAMLKWDLKPGDVVLQMQAIDRGSAMSRATLGRLLAGTTAPREEQVDLLLRVLLLSGEIEMWRTRYRSVRTAMETVKSPWVQTMISSAIR